MNNNIKKQFVLNNIHWVDPHQVNALYPLEFGMEFNPHFGSTLAPYLNWALQEYRDYYHQEVPEGTDIEFDWSVYNGHYIIEVGLFNPSFDSEDDFEDNALWYYYNISAENFIEHNLNVDYDYLFNYISKLMSENELKKELQLAELEVTDPLFN